jgi:hypothetical protein
MAVESYEPLAQEGEHDFPETEPSLSNDLDEQYLNSRIRPVVYYGHGTFDPPSSDDEEENLLETNASSPGLADRFTRSGSEKVGEQ